MAARGRVKPLSERNSATSCDLMKTVVHAHFSLFVLYERFTSRNSLVSDRSNDKSVFLPVINEIALNPCEFLFIFPKGSARRKPMSNFTINNDEAQNRSLFLHQSVYVIESE